VSCVSGVILRVPGSDFEIQVSIFCFKMYGCALRVVCSGFRALTSKTFGYTNLGYENRVPAASFDLSVSRISGKIFRISGNKITSPPPALEGKSWATLAAAATGILLSVRCFGECLVFCVPGFRFSVFVFRFSILGWG